MTRPTQGLNRRSLLACSGALAMPPLIHSEKPVGWADVERRVQTLQTSAVAVLLQGRTVWTHGDQTVVSYLASARKSVMAMLFGPAVARDEIQLDASLAEIGLDDVGGLLDRERRATVRQLMQARSGVYHPAANAGDASALAPPRGSVEPGDRFLYNNWDFNALGAVYERMTGRTVYQGLTRDLAEPLGLQDWRPDLQQVRNDTGASLHPAHHIALSTRDMARLGQAMLDRGRWKERQVLTPEWVDLITCPVTPAAEVARASPFIDGLGYAYLWWTFDQGWPPAFIGGYTASGAFGQFITVLPAVRLVVAHKTVAPSDRNVPPEVYLRDLLPLIVRAAAVEIRPIRSEL
ncbi:serine hydrolase domain-containing protein [Brevundimonas faecalis]|uniref:serine hydrolase domain-containing protein n=1 Tax=Brevundimonas faecalis TaxID=947378 RepID=UPI0036212FB8